MPTDYTDELTTGDRDELTEVVRQCGAYSAANGIARYSFYRRKGFNKYQSLAFTRIYIRNDAEQHARRLNHETGATGWKLAAGHA